MEVNLTLADEKVTNGQSSKVIIPMVLDSVPRIGERVDIGGKEHIHRFSVYNVEHFAQYDNFHRKSVMRTRVLCLYYTSVAHSDFDDAMDDITKQFPNCL